jgi:hypothetical protein
MKPSQVIPSLCRGYLIGEGTYSYDQQLTGIYALGVGCCTDPSDEDELNFVISSSDNFKILPTFSSVIQPNVNYIGRVNACPGIPEYDPMLELLGEQKVEIFSPLPPAMEGRVTWTVVDVQDKKTGALLIYEKQFFANDGTLMTKTTGKSFMRGIGGFGDPGIIKDPIPPVPTRTPDTTYSEATSLNQPVIYQLLGDHNPHNIYRDKAAGRRVRQTNYAWLVHNGLQCQSSPAECVELRCKQVQILQCSLYFPCLPWRDSCH